MPRTRQIQSPIARIVEFFMSSPLAEAHAALETAGAIVKQRQAMGLQQPSLTIVAHTAAASVKRGRKPRQAKLEELVGGPAPAVTAIHDSILATLPPTTPIDVGRDPLARRKRGRPRVNASTADPEQIDPQDLPPGSRPLPPQYAPGE